MKSAATQRRHSFVGLLFLASLCLAGCSKNSADSDRLQAATGSSSPNVVETKSAPKSETDILQLQSGSAERPSLSAPGSGQRADRWILLAIISLVLALVSILLSAYLLFWRRHLPDGQVSVLPERVLKAMEQLSGYNVSSLKAAAAFRDQSKHQFLDVQKSFDIFTNVSAQKDAQIERLQQGGDKQVYRQFLKRFVRVLNMVDDDIQEDRSAGRETQALESLRRYLADALQDSGLEEFSPALGADYRRQQDTADKPAILRTSDPILDWKISSVLRPGFLMRTGHDPVIIEPARVEIFRFEEVGD